MLKLNQSYSKKVPATGEYTSQSYHCQIEVELPDGLSEQELTEKARKVFEFVRNSVEAELHNNAPAQQPVQQMMPPLPQQNAPQQQPAPQPPVQQYYDPQQPVQQQYYDPQQSYPQPQQAPQQQFQQPAPQYQQNQGKQHRNGNAAASAKQVNYLLSLAKRAGWTIQQILQRCQVQAVEQIPSKVCSQMIQEFSGTPA
jgi:hypothetical protein